jgi:hypothetical protein
MKTKTSRTSDSCCAKPSLKERRLLTPIQAGGLAAVFKVLANDTRLRLLQYVSIVAAGCVRRDRRVLAGGGLRQWLGRVGGLPLLGEQADAFLHPPCYLFQHRL